MKSAILAVATILLSVSLASAQTRLPFKIDTTATPKLGFHKPSQWFIASKGFRGD